MAGSPIVVLDIGASKVLCLVGETHDDQVKILGMGQSPCAGFRRSAIIDMTKVVEAIRHAVREAERTANLKITGAYVGMAGEGIDAVSHCSTVTISGSSTLIDEEDVQRAQTAAEQESAATLYTIMHRIVQSYAVDGEPVQNPLWLHGSRLAVETLTVTASNHVCTTIERAAAEAGLDIAGFLLEPLAAAETTLSVDEREMGVGLLDIGAGACDLALFCGPLRHIVEIPFGGEDITRDLSMVLNISPREAEQLKRDYGGVCCTEGDETLTFNTTAGRTNSMTRQQLSEIIEARQQEIFEFVRDAITATPHGQMLAAGLVLTGGGALLSNITQLAEEVLGIPVRIGTPHDLVAPDAQQDPSFATAVGLLRFAGGDHEELGKPQAPEPASNGFLGRLSRILSLF